VPADDLVPVQPDPDTADLRGAVLVQGDEVSEPIGVEQLTGAVGKIRDGGSLSATVA
jgi:hypothetical protein